MLARPVDVMDPNYLNLLNTFNAQQKQSQANAKTHDEFLQTADNWWRLAERNRELGIPYPAPPTPPLMVVINDDGTQSHPPFADLFTPTLPAVATLPSSSMFGAAPATDRTDLLLAQMLVLNSKLDRLLAR